MVVVIDTPHGPNGDHGGTVAAPIFQRIAEASLRYLGVAPTMNAVPPVLVARHMEPLTSTTSAPVTADACFEARARRGDSVPTSAG